MNNRDQLEFPVMESGEAKAGTNCTADPSIATIMVEMPKALLDELVSLSYRNYRHPMHEIIYRLERSVDDAGVR